MNSFTRNEGIATVVVVVTIAVVIGLASVFVTKKNDNPVEQAAEAIIKAETGLDVDLTPEQKAFNTVD